MVRRCFLFLAVCLLALSGCETLDRADLSLRSTSSGRERLVPGGTEDVAKVARSVLRERGMPANVSRGEDEVRVRSRTSGGDAFCLVITRAGDRKTRVRLEWDKLEDEATGYSILASLDAANN